jgi:hypothetical protein
MADKVITGALMLLGAGLLFAVWYYGYLPFSVVKAILTEGI